MSGTPVSRRQLVGGGLAGLAGLGVAGTVGVVTGRAQTRAATPDGTSPGSHGRPGLDAVVPFDGAHQAGVATAQQRSAAFVGLDLRADVGRAELVSMMTVLTEDARRLCQGLPVLGAADGGLAAVPASLTVTAGFGQGLLHAAGLQQQAPPWLRALPAFGVDRLQERWSGADLLLQVCADDDTTVANATRSLSRGIRSFAEVRWVQRGFARATSPQAGESVGHRNLFGQVDGTVNPRPGTDELDRLVWVDDGPDWLRGGTGMVLRRIWMDLDDWDRLGRVEQEQVVGRGLADGTPLVASPDDPDEVDLDALDASGLRTVPPWSHVRRARGDGPAGPQFLRRSYNYDDGPGETGAPDAGSLFVVFCADVDAQFVPAQRRLDELDLLNDWTTPVGSVVVAVPPGCGPDGFLGQELLA
ncbi:Dyp-type peroxidase [Aquipuribacter sp. MA13-6]|uniref:Dyp-type peroxidase n=1 Tax=unclassified Aquipuribacter TaxID=2635084 RepID=UPI003EE914C2